MAQRLRQFLAPDGLRTRRAGPSVEVALFGKHPAETGFFEMGLPKGSSLEEAYGWLFLGGITSNYDAWKAVPADRRLEFNHPFVWVRGDRWIAGWMTESRDSAGAGGYPLVVCAEFHQVDLHRAVGAVMAWLEECRQSLISAPSLDRIREILKSRHSRLQELIAAFPLGDGRRSPSFAVTEAFLKAPALGDGALGLQRLTGIVDSDLDSLLAGRPWYSGEVPLPAYRVPGLPEVGASFSAWAHWLDCLLGRDLPVLLVQAIPGGHLDVFLGQPGEAALAALRRGTSLLGLTTQRPREVDAAVVARWERVRDQFLGKDGSTEVVANPKATRERTTPVRLPRWSVAVAGAAALLLVVAGWWRLSIPPERRVVAQLAALEAALGKVPDGLEDGERAIAGLTNQLAAIAQDPAWRAGVPGTVSNQWQKARERYGQWTNGLAVRRRAVADAETALREISNRPVDTRGRIEQARQELTNVVQKLGQDSGILAEAREKVIARLMEAEKSVAAVKARQQQVTQQAREAIEESRKLIQSGVRADTNRLNELGGKLAGLDREAREAGLAPLANDLARAAQQVSEAVRRAAAAGELAGVRDALGRRLQDQEAQLSRLTDRSRDSDWGKLERETESLVKATEGPGLQDLSRQAQALRDGTRKGRAQAAEFARRESDVQERLAALEKRLGPDQPALPPGDHASVRQELSNLRKEVDRLQTVAFAERLSKLEDSLNRMEGREATIRRLAGRLEQLASQIEAARTDAAARPSLRAGLDALAQEVEPLADPALKKQVQGALARLATLPDVAVATVTGGPGSNPGGGGTVSAQGTSTLAPAGWAPGPFGVPFVEMKLLGKTLWVGAAEITRGEFRQVMGKLPDGWVASSDVKVTGPVGGKEDLHPVTFVSPREAEEFCRRLGEAPGGGLSARRFRYRLPTWEEHRELRGERGVALNPNLKGTGLRERPATVTSLVDAWGNAGELASKDGGWVVVGASFKDRDTAINNMLTAPPPALDPPGVTQGFRVLAEPLP